MRIVNAKIKYTQMWTDGETLKLIIGFTTGNNALELLETKEITTNHSMFISKLLDVAEVRSYEDLPRKFVRIGYEEDGSTIRFIKNIMSDEKELDLRNYR